jgi:hypothetical protein
MKSATEYLDSTETAVIKLLEGIESYLEILRKGFGVQFSEPFPLDSAASRDAWCKVNARAIAEQKKSQKEFSGQLFALAILAGSILQVAAKGIECFSEEEQIPGDFEGLIKPTHAKFCVGKKVRGVLSGLIIYAGRNQYAHMNESALRPLNVAVFDQLAKWYSMEGMEGMENFIDPMFDLSNPKLTVYAANITGILDWRGKDGYSKYRSQMEGMLGI